MYCRVLMFTIRFMLLVPMYRAHPSNALLKLLLFFHPFSYQTLPLGGCSAGCYSASFDSKCVLYLFLLLPLLLGFSISPLSLYMHCLYSIQSSFLPRSIHSILLQLDQGTLHIYTRDDDWNCCARKCGTDNVQHARQKRQE